jgi:multimeric flavodoxin WrbA
VKKIFALNGSPRPTGNTSHLLSAFTAGAEENGAEIEICHSYKLTLEECTGCLRCNLLKRCSISGDDWADLQGKILRSDVLVFASPVYFHHLPASLKRVLDRFRSFVQVGITETGLVHQPYQNWNKVFVLILTQGSPDPADSQPVIDLFKYICSIMGAENRIHVITATRLAVLNQVVKGERELSELYAKMSLPVQLAEVDFRRNAALLERCRELGKDLSNPLNNQS